MEIKIRDLETGIIYSNSLSKDNNYSILQINFTTESTEFEVQDRFEENGKVLFRVKQLEIPVVNGLHNAIISAISCNSLAEWVQND